MNSHIEMMKNDAHADEFLKQIFPDFRKHWLPDPENVNFRNFLQLYLDESYIS